MNFYHNALPPIGGYYWCRCWNAEGNDWYQAEPVEVFVEQEDQEVAVVVLGDEPWSWEDLLADGDVEFQGPIPEPEWPAVPEGTPV